MQIPHVKAQKSDFFAFEFFLEKKNFQVQLKKCKMVHFTTVVNFIFFDLNPCENGMAAEHLQFSHACFTWT